MGLMSLWIGWMRLTNLWMDWVGFVNALDEFLFRSRLVHPDVVLESGGCGWDYSICSC